MSGPELPRQSVDERPTDYSPSARSSLFHVDDDVPRRLEGETREVPAEELWGRRRAETGNERLSSQRGAHGVGADGAVVHGPRDVDGLDRVEYRVRHFLDGGQSGGPRGVRSDCRTA